jgi:hypothetical protein
VPKSGRGATGSLPFRMRSKAARIVGIFAVSRIALRRFAGSELSSASGSWSESPETAVRSAAMASASAGKPRSMSRIGSEIACSAASSRCSPSSSSRFGSRPFQRRYATSSNVVLRARSSISYPA